MSEAMNVLCHRSAPLFKRRVSRSLSCRHDVLGSDRPILLWWADLHAFRHPLGVVAQPDSMARNLAFD